VSARLTGLPPAVDRRARVLILGSFPSAASLAAGQYYAHPQNQFWRVLGAVIERPLKEMDYSARIAAVQAAGIAIWDVYASCERAGSLDSAIREAPSPTILPP
jgi:TDG/mug DNA glycosylase family protein